MIFLDIEPCPAPRMTRSDKWKLDPNHPDPKKRQRVCVAKYFVFKDKLQWLCKKEKYTLQPEVTIKFELPMPEKWSEKKKKLMEGNPHKSRPDIDNLFKAFADSFGNDDGFVWCIKAWKTWARKGSIIIYEQ